MSLTKSLHEKIGVIIHGNGSGEEKTLKIATLLSGDYLSENGHKISITVKKKLTDKADVRYLNNITYLNHISQNNAPVKVLWFLDELNATKVELNLDL